MIPSHLKPNVSGLVPVLLLARYVDGCRQLPEGYIVGLTEQRAIEAVQSGRAQWPTAAQLAEATADRISPALAPERHPAPASPASPEPAAESPVTPADVVAAAEPPPVIDAPAAPVAGFAPPAEHDTTAKPVGRKDKAPKPGKPSRG